MCFRFRYILSLWTMVQTNHPWAGLDKRSIQHEYGRWIANAGNFEAIKSYCHDIEGNPFHIFLVVCSIFHVTWANRRKIGNALDTIVSTFCGSKKIDRKLILSRLNSVVVHISIHFSIGMCSYRFFSLICHTIERPIQRVRLTLFDIELRRKNRTAVMLCCLCTVTKYIVWN